MIPVNVKKGDSIVFGKYAPQGLRYAPFGKYKEGYKKLPIRWTVLEVREERILVLADHILDMKHYHYESRPTRWEECYLRNWLNGAFYDAAFSGKEKAQIWEPEYFPDPDGEYLWRTHGLETDTECIQDRIFLLNGVDLDRHFPKEGLLYEGISTVGTENVEKKAGSELCWWLRNTLREREYACIVSPCNTVGASLISEDNENGVRPALWLRR